MCYARDFILLCTLFQSHIDGDRFLEDLERNVTTPTAFDAVLRVRTSAGEGKDILYICIFCLFYNHTAEMILFSFSYVYLNSF